MRLLYSLSRLILFDLIQSSRFSTRNLFNIKAKAVLKSFESVKAPSVMRFAAFSVIGCLRISTFIKRVAASTPGLAIRIPRDHTLLLKTC